MGIYALTHLPGNLLAGNLIDRHGSRRYIIFSLTAAGVILLLQAHVNCLAAARAPLDQRIRSGLFVTGLSGTACVTLGICYARQIYVRSWRNTLLPLSCPRPPALSL